MKMRAEVLECATNGDVLTIKMQGGSKRDAHWRRLGVQTVQVADTKKNRRAFHVGRIVKLDVKPCES